jgi:G3E family GTPase
MAGEMIAMTVFIPLSGFLGAGKTTLMIAAAERLRAGGYTAVCVTNDQGGMLVDASMVENAGIPAGQIRGGCFCCRFNELTDVLHELIAAHRPDFILAEAVGSCTDLTATVIRPLKSMHGEAIRVRPLTTVIDSLRLEEMLTGSDEGFTPEIRYIFRKQLEEAACLVLNKTDLITEARAAELIANLQAQYPGAAVLSAVSNQNRGVGEWLDYILSSEAVSAAVLDIDYDLYAEGEAQLGWLNAAFTWEGTIHDVESLCRAFLARLSAQLGGDGAAIAHLKLWAQDETHRLKMSVVRNESACETDVQPAAVWPSQRVSVWLNARVRIEHERLMEQVRSALDELRSAFGLEIAVHELECFAPARPVPTYRMG